MWILIGIGVSACRMLEDQRLVRAVRPEECDECRLEGKPIANG